MPPGVDAVAHGVKADISGYSIAKQDVGGPVTVVVAGCNDTVGGRGRADIVPALVGAVDDLVEAGVPGGVVAIEDVVSAVAVEVADSHHAVGGRGTADVD